MPSFDYEAISKQGQIVNGQLISDNLDQAVERLRGMGLSIIELKEVKVKKKRKFISFKPKVELSDLTLFSRQFAAMINAGIPITKAIYTLGKQSENPVLAETLENIASNVEGGMNLTDAFSAYPDIFSELYIAMIQAGEVGGTLENSLVRLSEQLQNEKNLKDEIKSALSYPKIIGIFAAVIFFAMLAFLVPVFRGFSSDGAKINPITQFIYNASDSIRTYPYIWVLVIVAIVISFIAFFKSKVGHDIWERSKLTLPVFGPLILKSVIARFTRTLGTLLEGGLPVVQALISSGPTSGSDVVNEAVQLAAEKIEEGKSIASTLEESGVFPPMVTQMISVGEETGSLPRLLDRIAEFYEQEVSTEARGLQTLIQPIAIVVIGALIGGMLIALYLPIFSAVTSSGG